MSFGNPIVYDFQETSQVEASLWALSCTSPSSMSLAWTLSKATFSLSICPLHPEDPACRLLIDQAVSTALMTSLLAGGQNDAGLADTRRLRFSFKSPSNIFCYVLLKKHTFISLLSIQLRSQDKIKSSFVHSHCWSSNTIGHC